MNSNDGKHQHHKHAGHSGGHDHGAMVSDYRKRFWISSLMTISVLLLSNRIQSFIGIRELLAFKGDMYLLFVFSSLVYFYGGWPFLRGFFDELAKFKPGMMTLIAIAISVAYFYSALVVFGLAGEMFFWELATLIDIMLLGHWIEMKSILGAGKALEELVKLMPSMAHQIMLDGSSADVPISKLSLKDRLLVKPGEKIPVDGVVITGETSVNESMLTGESKPIAKMPGAIVIGGSIDGEGSVVVEVKKIGKDTFLAQVIELVKKVQESKSKTQDIANRAAMWLTLIALVGGSLTLFG